MKGFFSNRYNILYIFVSLLVGILVFQVINLQVIKGDYYASVANSRGYSSHAIEAPRGEILDREGKIIASNTTIQTVYIIDNGLETEEFNRGLYELLVLAESIGKKYEDTLPMTDQRPYTYTFETIEGEKRWKEQWKIDENETAESLFEFLKEKYQVEGFDEEYTRKLIGLKFDLKKNNFSASNPFEFVRDVDIDTISLLKENKKRFPCVAVDILPVRSYPLGKTASHMLGYISMINEEEYAEKKSQGYGMQDYIGKTGLEKYLEKDLKGTDGKTGLTVDVNGSKTLVNEDIPAVPGNNVYLTVDIDLQQAAEAALAEAISVIREGQEGNFIGGGAAVAIDVKTGAVLTLANYPNYNPATFNKDYNMLIEDKNNPIYNRAIAGTYSPGSTFKPLVALAGLNEGVITVNETIDCTGKYQHYAPSYSPSCWIYGYHGRNHGHLNVSGAIENSCNIYFFETGRRLKINDINRYAKMFGFGKVTGIEIDGEKSGVVAGIEEREEMGGDWYPADTIQAAIGQSDNKFTILQIANYCAALANRGTLYKPYLVDSVYSGKDGKLLKKTSPQVLTTVKFQDKYWDAVQKGMLAVTTEGSAVSVFENAGYKVAGKTGTAQTSNTKNDSLFICYAPYDDPQIAVACIIENGGIYGQGNQVVGVAKKILDTFFIKKGVIAPDNNNDSAGGTENGSMQD